MRQIVWICISLLLVVVCYGQNTTRRSLKLKPEPVTIQVDSSRTARKSIKVTGYEKCTSQTKETMFVTNAGADTVSKVNLTITYSDIHGHQLHKRTETLSILLPPGETRLVNLRSWDSQHHWHYRHSATKPKTKSKPYDIDILINYVEH